MTTVSEEMVHNHSHFFSSSNHNSRDPTQLSYYPWLLHLILSLHEIAKVNISSQNPNFILKHTEKQTALPESSLLEWSHCKISSTDSEGRISPTTYFLNWSVRGVWAGGREGSYMQDLRPPSFNPLSPNIHIQILQTDLYTFPLRIS